MWVATHIFAAKISMNFENTLATTVNEFVIKKLVNSALNNWALLFHCIFNLLRMAVVARL